MKQHGLRSPVLSFDDATSMRRLRVSWLLVARIQRSQFRMLLKNDEKRAEALLKQAQQDVKERWLHYQHLASMSIDLLKG